MPKKNIICQRLPISTAAIEPPYDKLVESLQTLTIEFPGELDPGVADYLLTQSLEFWDTLLHWVTKLKWNSKHKVPGGQAHTRATKPWGEMLYRLLELCIQCHAGVGHKAAGYPDAACWFEEIWVEYVLGDIAFTAALMFGLEDSKTNWAAGLRQTTRELRNYQNPYDSVQQPHLHKLIKCSLHLAGKSDHFRNQYWLPYVQSLVTCANQVERNEKGYYKTVVVKETQRSRGKNAAVYQVGRDGKSLKRIYPI